MSIWHPFRALRQIEADRKAAEATCQAAMASARTNLTQAGIAIREARLHLAAWQADLDQRKAALGDDDD